MIENYLHIVDYVSSRLAIGLPKNVSKDDLASNGVMGLIDAVDKFDYKRGLQFETYASFRVRGRFSIRSARATGFPVPSAKRRKNRRCVPAAGTETSPVRNGC